MLFVILPSSLFISPHLDPAVYSILRIFVNLVRLFCKFDVIGYLMSLKLVFLF